MGFTIPGDGIALDMDLVTVASGVIPSTVLVTGVADLVPGVAEHLALGAVVLHTVQVGAGVIASVSDLVTADSTILTGEEVL